MTGAAVGREKILIVEPQCWDLEHASFNAALLASVLSAYPDDEVVFMGEECHLRNVRVAITKYAPRDAARVEWRPISLLPRYATGWLRFFAEYRDFAGVLGEAERLAVRCVLFMSVSNSGVLALKLRMRQWPESRPVFTVMHGMLNRIVGRWPTKPWNWLLNLRALLRLPQPPGLWYLVLGDSIHRALVEMQPRLVKNFQAIDIPNIPADTPSAADTVTADGTRLRFGHLGVGNITKGFGIFARIAKEFANVSPGAEFTLVGYLSTFREDTDYSAVTGIVDEPLPLDEYARRAESLTYAVNAANPQEYKLAGSSSFIEALFYGKPGICLRNDYVEDCFRVMGDIGYLCDTPEQMIETIGAIIREFPEERYNKQVANIIRGRAKFAPQAVGHRLRTAVDVATRKAR
jgi:hypothetical protein